MNFIIFVDTKLSTLFDVTECISDNPLFYPLKQLYKFRNIKLMFVIFTTKKQRCDIGRIIILIDNDRNRAIKVVRYYVIYIFLLLMYMIYICV